MPVILSLYLDLVRFWLLPVFFLSIFPQTDYIRGLWWRLGNYGAVGVIIFFVLSGYVIAYVLSTRENSIGPYFSNRISRLYSVALPALILTFTLDSVGIFINPDFYQMKAVLWRPESWSGYISSIFFLNEYQIFDFGGISPGTNGPYWSLSFEATYYLVAGVAIFLPL
jgi:peptidoglycan/LPS O-acetylase OafA/YrhL